MQILAALPSAPNLFPSPPSNPRINEPLPSPPPPPLPLPTKTTQKHAAFRSIHTTTKYTKPVSPGTTTIPSSSTDPNTRSILIGDAGISYLLPGSPFEFQFSYSEIPTAKPLAVREPLYLPFAPPEMPRPWTGKSPLLSKKEKERRKGIRLVGAIGEGSGPSKGEGKAVRIAGRVREDFGRYVDGRSREEILGENLTRDEVAERVKPCLACNRQVNLGRDGLTHNMLELIHSHWRRQEVCKVRCRGVPTVDMNNVCYHLEEKTGGKIIRRTGGIVYLFRGRNYNHRTRPKYPVMLWKPAAPVYPKLIQEAPEGLTKEEAEELRLKGQNLLPICKLAKNGIFLSLVKDVRDAFELSNLVKVNCQGLDPSDYKKIGAKLKDLVPCVLLSFDQEQILMWRGKDWKSRYHTPISLVPNISINGDSTSSYFGDTDLADNTDGESTLNKVVSSPKMMSLWKRALESNKALLIDETELTPDSLLESVEEFEGISQAAEHSYPALIISGGRANALDEYGNDGSQVEDDKEYGQDSNDFCDELQSSVPFGALPVDLIAERLHREI